MYKSKNLNRANAVKQLQKAINNVDDDIEYDEHEMQIRFLRTISSIANSFTYIGDMLKERNDLLREEIDNGR